MKCTECKRFKTIANSEECRKGVCSYENSWQFVDMDNDCVYMPKPLTCQDCDRFGNDFACFAMEADDLVIDEEGRVCGGFIDKNESAVFNSLAVWALRGEDVQEKLNKVLEKFNSEFEVPFQPLD